MSPNQHTLYYLSTDRGNGAEAWKLACGRKIDLELIEPRDLPGLDGARVIVDADSISRRDRERLVNSGRLTVVAMHGYSLEEAEAFLAERGVVVCRRLTAELFSAL